MPAILRRRRSSLDDLLNVLGLDLGLRGERLHEGGVGDDAEGEQGVAGMAGAGGVSELCPGRHGEDGMIGSVTVA